MERAPRQKTIFISDLEQIVDDIRWIVIYYYNTEYFNKLKKNIESKKDGPVRDFIVQLYKILPKGKFNTLVNPPGWSQLETFCEKHDIS